MNVGYPKDCIFIFDNFLTDEECLYFIEMIDKYAVKGREKYGHRSNVTADSVNVAEISDPSGRQGISKLIYESIPKLCKNFNVMYDIKMCGFETPTLRRITGATKYHKDGVLGRVGDPPKLRNMSIIVALNGDYEGGELCFPEQNRTIKLKRGQAVAFPPYWTHPHYTNELFNGTVRYTVNFWTHEG